MSKKTNKGGHIDRFYSYSLFLHQVLQILVVGDAFQLVLFAD